MKMKTTLCAVLLSLTSISMIACNDSKSNSAPAQKAALTTTVDSLAVTLEKAKGDLAEANAVRDQLIITSEGSTMAVKYAEADLKDITDEAVNTGDTHALNKIASYQDAVAEAKAENDEVSKEIKSTELAIDGLELQIEMVEAQIRVRDNNKLISGDSKMLDSDKNLLKVAIEADNQKITEINEKLSPKGM